MCWRSAQLPADVQLALTLYMYITVGSTSQHSSEVLERAMLDGGETPALPPSSLRPPAYSEAGALHQPDFGMQDGPGAGQVNTGYTPGEQLVYWVAGSDTVRQFDTMLHHDHAL